MKRTNVDEIKNVLFNRLSEESYLHSVRTMEIAEILADIHAVDSGKTVIAALLHDYARDLSNEELIASAKKSGIEINWVEEKVPYLLHGPIGAMQVKEEFDITDESILNAIRKHTYGATEMNQLDRIVYIADLIEPGRDGGRIGKVRAMAEIDLNDAFKLAYEDQISSLINQGRYIHPITAEVWNRIVNMEKTNE